MSRDWLEHHQIGLYFVAVAIAAVAGLASEGIADLAAMAITPAIAVLMYAMFLQIPFLELRQAFANRRFVGALLLANFVLVPLLVWLLTLPLSANKALLAGALLVLLTPCIDYVVVFTHLGKGDSRLVLAATPLLLLLQLLMLPFYLQLMLGTQVGTVIAPVADRRAPGTGRCHRAGRETLRSGASLERRLGLAARAGDGNGTGGRDRFADRRGGPATGSARSAAAGLCHVHVARPCTRSVQRPAVPSGGSGGAGGGLQQLHSQLAGGTATGAGPARADQGAGGGRSDHPDPGGAGR